MALTKVRGFGLGTLDDNITFSTAGKGVHLGVTSATSSNLMDDYEQGLFTPTLTAGTSGSFTLESGSANGVYTKIGDLVTVQVNLFTSAISSPVGNLVVGNLPFTSATNSVDGGSSNYNGRTAGSVYMDLQASGESGNFMALLIANSTTAIIYNGEDTSVTGSANLIDASTYIALGLTYRTQ
tara:strand:- start:591 stop:1136 length:546 start_codon:yes stop_codon:yes gene_type:complete